MTLMKRNFSEVLCKILYPHRRVQSCHMRMFFYYIGITCMLSAPWYQFHRGYFGAKLFIKTSPSPSVPLNEASFLKLCHFLICFSLRDFRCICISVLLASLEYLYI